jgi:hypothetical protein
MEATVVMEKTTINSDGTQTIEKDHNQADWH